VKQWLVNSAVRTAMGVLRLGHVRHSERIPAQDDSVGDLKLVADG
jgi:hypothetical protein